MKRVLVIDDDPSVARLVRAALKAADVEHTLEFCTDGGQGRAKAAQGKYDLITLDLAMPLMDGVQALEEMKKDPKSARVPVVVVTAKTDPALHARVEKLGAAAVVTKPFRRWELVSLFRLLLAGGQIEPTGGAESEAGDSSRGDSE